MDVWNCGSENHQLNQQKPKKIKVRGYQHQYRTTTSYELSYFTDHYSGGSKEGGLLGLFFFTKATFTSKKLVLNEYEICLKKLEMAILETQFFKNFRGCMPPDPPARLRRSLVPPPNLKVLDSPLQCRGYVKRSFWYLSVKQGLKLYQEHASCQ